MRQKFSWKKLTIGVCYYPEQWDRSLWEEDLLRMKEAGISVIRIGEFAWNLIEPKEGVFTFSFFDDFLSLCQRYEMSVIFGTPTAAPPAWMSEKYPEVLNADITGVRYRHGGRRHYTYNSPVYRCLAAEVVREEAAHFGPNPALIGWQIDNEVNCEMDEFYSEADDEAFRVFLQKKYPTLAALNKAWGTVFWDQTYTDWTQVHLPRPLPSDSRNPHQWLDYLRFISDSAVSFCRMQADIIRPYCKPNDFITTNGMFAHLDNHRLMRECLDIYMYDSYPNFAFSCSGDPAAADPMRDRRWSQYLTQVRSICPHFGIMEQQSGANGWTSGMEAPNPRPGQLSLWAMQSVAQGADFVSFFRWRTAVMGTEINWHGILDCDNRDNARLSEVKDFAQKAVRIGEVCGAMYVAELAMLFDYDNAWDAECDAWHRRVSESSEPAIFAAAELLHTPIDVVCLPQEDEGTDEECADEGALDNELTQEEEEALRQLKKYRAALYPHPSVMTKRRAKILSRYVSAGGTLFVGCRAGHKKKSGQCVMMPQPGLLRELMGAEAAESTPNDPAADPVWAVTNEFARLPMPFCCEAILPDPGTKVLAVYENGPFAGQAAAAEHSYGKGKAILFGSVFTEESTKWVLTHLSLSEPFSSVIEAPREAEVLMRRKGGRAFLFVLNFSDGEISCRLKQKAVRLDVGGEADGPFTLPAYAAAVFSLPASAADEPGRRA